jgi:predicted transcriptional regulator
MSELAGKLRQNAKYAKMLSEKTMDTLKTLTESEEAIKVQFVEGDHYEQVQLLVKEGFVSKEFALYTISEEGQSLYEGVISYNKNAEEIDDQIHQLEESEKGNTVSVSYKSHLFEKNLIQSLTATFELDESDGLPVIKVDEASYSGLLHREKGQHWKKYLGEGGRALVRQRKLNKFYVEDESTGRRYLYIVPKTRAQIQEETKLTEASKDEVRKAFASAYNGKTSKEELYVKVAKRLNLSPATVKSYVSSWQSDAKSKEDAIKKSHVKEEQQLDEASKDEVRKAYAAAYNGKDSKEETYVKVAKRLKLSPATVKSYVSSWQGDAKSKEDAIKKSHNKPTAKAGLSSDVKKNLDAIEDKATAIDELKKDLKHGDSEHGDSATIKAKLAYLQGK